MPKIDFSQMPVCEDNKYIDEIFERPAEKFLSSIGLEKVDLCGGIIAGGSVRAFVIDSEEVNDIDIFLPEPPHVNFIPNNWDLIIPESIVRSPLGHINIELKGCPHKVQLIITDCAKTVNNILLDFDLRMCRFAYKDNTIYSECGAIEDCRNKTMMFRAFHTPVLSLSRSLKYIKRGYNYESCSYLQMLKYLKDMKSGEFEKQINCSEEFIYDGAFGNE